MNQQSRDRRVHAAGKSANDRGRAYPLADSGHRLFSERAHAPVAFETANGEGKVAQDVFASLGVGHFGMELESVKPAAPILKGGNWSVLGPGGELESRRRALDGVPVTCPDPERRTDSEEEKARPVEMDRRRAVLPMARRPDSASKRLRHELHPVTDAKHRNSQLKDRWLATGRSRLVDAVWTAGEDEGAGRPAANQLRRRRARENLAIDRHLAQPTGNEPGVLRPEIEYEDGLVRGGAGHGPLHGEERGAL